MPDLGVVAEACINEVYPDGGDLFRPALLRELLAIASSLPHSLTWGGFECRLCDDEPRVDFGASVDLHDATELLDDENRGLCQQMLRNWLSLEPARQATIPRAILEFDSDLDPERVRTSPWDHAFAFFRVALAGGPELSVTLSELLASLTSTARASAPTIAHALPFGSQILHVTALDHRGASETRLQYAVRSDYLPTLCAEVADAWPRTGELLRDLIAGLPLDRIAIQASDLTGSFRPYSVEFSIPGARDPLSMTLVDRLVAQRLADPAKAAALLLWPGTSGYTLAGRAQKHVQAHRAFNLTLRLGPRPTAKAYPYFHCQDISSSKVGTP